MESQSPGSEASGKEVRAEEDLLGKRTQIPRTKAKEKAGVLNRFALKNHPTDSRMHVFFNLGKLC